MRPLRSAADALSTYSVTSQPRAMDSSLMGVSCTSGSCPLSSVLTRA